MFVPVQMKVMCQGRHARQKEGMCEAKSVESCVFYPVKKNAFHISSVSLQGKGCIVIVNRGKVL